MPTTDPITHDGLLTVEQLDEGERIRLRLSGELDLSNVGTAETTLDAALGHERPVVVDMSKLEFLDSTGITLLVTAIRRGNGALLTFLPSETASVRRVLSLTGLDQKLPLADAAAERAILPPA